MTGPQMTETPMTPERPKLPPLAPFCAGPFSHMKGSSWVCGVDAFGGQCHLLDVRGWGYLTGRGTALALPDDVAMRAQKETAEWVVEALNAAWNRRADLSTQAAAIESAFKDGCTYAKNVRVRTDADIQKAWDGSMAKVRALAAPVKEG